MANLFEMTAVQASLMTQIEKGEISAEFAADTVEGMQGEVNNKLNDYCRVLRALEGQLDLISSEKERITKLEKQKKAEIDRLKEWMMVGLTNLGTTKFDTGLFKGHLRKGRESVVITNEALIPADYVETVITEKVDKTALGKALKQEGHGIEGAELQTGKSTLVIA